MECRGTIFLGNGIKKIKDFFGFLGPGLVTGAADDDPSGIATYSIAGAQFGTNLLWTALLTWPLMAAVQMMCARIGMVTGQGLIQAMEKKFPRPLLMLVCLGLLSANTFNIGADLAAMADAAEMLSGVNSRVFIILFAVAISWATIQLRYDQIARVLKWFTLFLFAYVVTAFYIGPDWIEALKNTVLPTFSTSPLYWSTVVAIFGTTISPYLFFWQTAMEVEEKKSRGQKSLLQRKGATDSEIVSRIYDVCVGTFFSNIVMFFIILTTALTLNKSGVTHIETTGQVIEALRPMAGRFATLLYTLGLLGVGFLAIPTLTSSSAYAIAEMFHWTEGLNEKLLKAGAFYGIVIFSTVVAVILDLTKFEPIKALYMSAIINGVLAPILLVLILVVARDPKIMRGQQSSKLGFATVCVACFLMFVAIGGLFLS